MEPVTVLAAAAILGYGFDEETLERGLERGPAVIAADCGSTDQGPCDLGSGSLHMSREAYRRDLSLMLNGARRTGAPVVVGTAGGAGTDAQVDVLVDIVLRLAAESGHALKVAAIYSELSPDWLLERLAQGRVRSLDPGAGPLSEEAVARSVHAVAMMGPEPIQQAIADGADVVIAGRSSDTAIFAAVPLMRGAGAGPSWHAGKILECGAASAVPSSGGDGMMAHVGEDSFVVEAPNPRRRCTPLSVAAHALYENPDPYLLYEPPGALETSACRYEDLGDGRVRVSGSAFRPAQDYTVRLEGAEFVGYRSFSIAGIRDTRLIAQLDDYMERVEAIVREKVESVHPELGRDDFALDFRAYGRDGVMGPAEPQRDRLGHEVGLLLSAIAPEQRQAASILGILRAMTVHTDFPGQDGLCSNLAFPMSPSDFDAGPVYRFNMRHVVELEDPLECVRTRWITAGSAEAVAEVAVTA
jgi:hypothetical protein